MSIKNTIFFLPTHHESNALVSTWCCDEVGIHSTTKQESGKPCRVVLVTVCGPFKLESLHEDDPGLFILFFLVGVIDTLDQFSIFWPFFNRKLPFWTFCGRYVWPGPSCDYFKKADFKENQIFTFLRLGWSWNRRSQDFGMDQRVCLCIRHSWNTVWSIPLDLNVSRWGLCAFTLDRNREKSRIIKPWK